MAISGIQKLFTSLTLLIFLMTASVFVKMIYPRQHNFEFSYIKLNIPAYKFTDYGAKKTEKDLETSDPVASNVKPKALKNKNIVKVNISGVKSFDYKKINSAHSLPALEMIFIPKIKFEYDYPLVTSWFEDFKGADSSETLMIATNASPRNDVDVVDIRVDRVVNKAAAPIELEDDLVMFDYSSETKVANSDEVSEGINTYNEIKSKSQNLKRQEFETINEDQVAEVGIEELLQHNPSTVTQINNLNVTESASGNSFWQNEANKISNSHQKLADSPILNSQKGPPNPPVPSQPEAISNIKSNKLESLLINVVSTNLSSSQDSNSFDVESLSKPGVYESDYSQGVVRWQYDKFNQTGVIGLRVSGKDIIDTFVDVDPGENNFLTVKTLSKNTFYELNSAHNGPTGALLIEVNKTINNVQIEGLNSQPILLDENMKKTEADDFRYLLYVNIPAGNQQLVVSLKNDKSYRVISVKEESVTYENIELIKQEENVELFERGLGAEKAYPLSIFGDKIKNYFNDERLEKKMLNVYGGNTISKAKLEKNYLSLLHLNEPIIVGFDQTRIVEVPSEERIRFNLQKMGGGINGQCIVQINLPQEMILSASSVEIYGGQFNSFSYQIKYEDNDGNFYETPSQTTRRMFIQGENTSSIENKMGKIYLSLEFNDGTNINSISYCTPNNYLVEQL